MESIQTASTIWLMFSFIVNTSFGLTQFCEVFVKTMTNNIQLLIPNPLLLKFGLGGG